MHLFLISLSTNCNWQLSARKSSRMDDHLCQSVGQPAYWHAQPGLFPSLLSSVSLSLSATLRGAISGAFRGKHCWRLMPSNLFDVYKSWSHCLAARHTHSRAHTHTRTHTYCFLAHTHTHTRLQSLVENPSQGLSRYANELAWHARLAVLLACSGYYLEQILHSDY